MPGLPHLLTPACAWRGPRGAPPRRAHLRRRPRPGLDAAHARRRWLELGVPRHVLPGRRARRPRTRARAATSRRRATRSATTAGRTGASGSAVRARTGGRDRPRPRACSPTLSRPAAAALPAPVGDGERGDVRGAAPSRRALRVLVDPARGPAPRCRPLTPGRSRACGRAHPGRHRRPARRRGTSARARRGSCRRCADDRRGLRATRLRVHRPWASCSRPTRASDRLTPSYDAGGGAPGNAGTRRPRRGAAGTPRESRTISPPIAKSLRGRK